MISHSNTWLHTRPIQPSNSPTPTPHETVVYRVPDVEGLVELWVFRHKNGTLGFEYMAWSKLGTAADPDYHDWMTLRPDNEAFCSTPETALQIGKEDARLKGLKLSTVERLNNQ